MPEPRNVKNTPKKTAEERAQATVAPLEQRIRIRAYELYEQRQGGPGDPESDWLRAEAEIAAKQTEVTK